MEETRYSGAYPIEARSGEHYEVRLLPTEGGRKKNLKPKSLYVCDDEQLNNLGKYWDTDDWQLYMTLNPVKSSVTKPSRDEDIVERRDILIDLDPERKANCMANEEERHAAFEAARRALEILEEEGFEEIVTASSGSGAHLHVPVAMGVDKESTETVKKFLEILNKEVGTVQVHVDVAVYNPGRICRLYGSMNRKGEPSEERPWRRSLILDEERKAWRRETAERNTSRVVTYVAKKSRGEVAAKAEVADAAEVVANNSWSVGLAKKILDSANVGYREEWSRDGSCRLLLERCPWEEEHTTESKPYESAVIIQSDGKLGYKCFHSHCSGRGWKELRAKLQQRIASEAVSIAPEPWEWGSSNDRWISPLDQLRAAAGDPYEGLMPTGFAGLDKQLRGLLPGQVTCLGGDTSCGKTTMAVSLALNLIERGYRCGYVSNEMSPQLLLEKFMQAAAVPSELETGTYDWQVKGDQKEAICQRLTGLVTHQASTASSEILASLSQMRGVDLVVIDNLMSTDLGTGDIYEAQKGFVQALTVMSQKLGCAILLICHTKKTGKELPRINDLFGSSNVGNLCDNIIMMFRHGPDFAQKMHGFYKSAMPISLTHNAYLAVLKNRTFGELGWSGLRYDGQRKRMVGGGN